MEGGPQFQGTLEGPSVRLRPRYEHVGRLGLGQFEKEYLMGRSL